MTPSISREEYETLLERQRPAPQSSPKPKRQVAKGCRRREEGALQLAILKYLRALGSVCGKTKTMGVKRGKGYSYDPWLFVGYPDITFFYGCKLFFCEVKRPDGGKQSEYQRQFQDECEAAGIPYILARSVQDVADVISGVK